jgi:hypothetical protein
MDKVQKRGFIKYNTPSSEPFRIELYLSNWLAIKIKAFWDIAPCNFILPRSSGWRIIHHPDNGGSMYLWTSAYFCEITQSHIPEGPHLHTCHHEKLKSHNILQITIWYKVFPEISIVIYLLINFPIYNQYKSDILSHLNIFHIFTTSFKVAMGQCSPWETQSAILSFQSFLFHSAYFVSVNVFCNRGNWRASKASNL